MSNKPSKASSTLEKQDYYTLNEVRKDIWVNGAKGGLAGALAGFSLHSLASFGNNRKWWTVHLNRNTGMGSVFLGLAAGSFLMAITTGKNEVHNLYPIFDQAAKKPSLYQENLQRARDQQAQDLNNNVFEDENQTSSWASASFANNPEQQRVERQRNRLFRRASLERTIREGHGLADAHGGHWVDPKADDKRKK